MRSVQESSHLLCGREPTPHVEHRADRYYSTPVQRLISRSILDWKTHLANVAIRNVTAVGVCGDVGGEAGGGNGEWGEWLPQYEGGSGMKEEEDGVLVSEWNHTAYNPFQRHLSKTTLGYPVAGPMRSSVDPVLRS